MVCYETREFWGMIIIFLAAGIFIGWMWGTSDEEKRKKYD